MDTASSADDQAPTGVGSRLREERERLGISQDQLARQTGVHRRTQVNYELGRRPPRAEYIEACSRLGIDWTYVEHGVRLVKQHEVAAMLLRTVLGTLGYEKATSEIIEGAYRREWLENQGPISEPSPDMVRLAEQLVLESPTVGRRIDAAIDVDVPLLAEVIVAIEREVAGHTKQVPIEKKALLVATLYRSAKSLGRLDPKSVSNVVSLAGLTQLS